MEQMNELHEIELIYVIVNFGVGSKIVKIAKHNGVRGVTTFLGMGTVKSKLLEFLDLTEVRKEIVMMVVKKDTAQSVLEKLNQEIHFERRNHGIAFTMPVRCILGSKFYHCAGINEDKGEQNTMYKAIYTIIDKGRAEEVLEAANQAGSKGGTVIQARGSSVHETHMLFSMPIEPEKEIVLILSETDSVGDITAAIYEKLDMDQPGNGIIFVQDINQVCGLYDDAKKNHKS